MFVTGQEPEIKCCLAESKITGRLKIVEGEHVMLQSSTASTATGPSRRTRQYQRLHI